MDDLVTRLRVGIHTSADPLALTNEAADRIEKLEAALRYYASDAAWTIAQVEGAYGDYGQIARAALAGGKTVMNKLTEYKRWWFEHAANSRVVTDFELQFHDYIDLMTSAEFFELLESIEDGVYLPRAALAGGKTDD